jgi:non-ribosomal peptide synthetase component F
MMGIEMAGCVYCPLSAEDPPHRLQTLVHQTQCRLVLIHWLTSNKLNHDTVTLDIDSVLNDNDIDCSVDVDRLESVIIIPDNIAYVVFTSGSTGTPKPVSLFVTCEITL